MSKNDKGTGLGVVRMSSDGSKSSVLSEHHDVLVINELLITSLSGQRGLGQDGPGGQECG